MPSYKRPKPTERIVHIYLKAICYQNNNNTNHLTLEYLMTVKTMSSLSLLLLLLVLLNVNSKQNIH